MTFASAVLLLLWVLASLFLTGIPLLHRFTRLRGIELLAYGAAAGVSLHAIVGWAIAAAPPARGVFVAFSRKFSPRCRPRYGWHCSAGFCFSCLAWVFSS